jgi:seryl-tRNA synthetase
MESQGKEETTMTIAEILKAKGISDELVQAVLDDMKANKIFTASEENLDVRYGKLKTQHDSVNQQLTEANALIADMKKSTKGQEELQSKVTAYETQIATLQAQLEETQIEADVHVALLSEGVKPDDIDYVMFKLKAKGKLERGEDGKVKELDDKIAAMKTQLPAQFTGEKKNILENKLPDDPDNGHHDGITRESLLKKPYAERMRIFNENPEAYKTAMNN